MSRPETIKDVKERMIRVATFDVARLMINPPLIKAYVAFIEAVEKQNGEVDVQYGTNVEVKVRRTDSELHDQLKSEQYQWDDNQKLYNRAVYRHHPDVDPPKEYQKDRVQEWAREEGLIDPYSALVDDFDEDVLAEIRGELGIL